MKVGIFLKFDNNEIFEILIIHNSGVMLGITKSSGLIGKAVH